MSYVRAPTRLRSRDCYACFVASLRAYFDASTECLFLLRDKTTAYAFDHVRFAVAHVRRPDNYASEVRVCAAYGS